MLCHAVAEDYPQIEVDDWYVDIMAANLVDPATRSRFQVFLLPNLYGDILTITETDIRWLIGLFFALAAFQIWGYNRLLYIGLNSVVAKAHRINVFFWQYLFAGLLALVVMFSVWAVGVLLVTALLIVPAATARNLARTAGGMFWWSILVSVTSAVAGLVLSAQEWAGTATGATVVLVSCGWFLLSAVLAAIRGEGRRQ